jgi:hypothetical protein
MSRLIAMSLMVITVLLLTACYPQDTIIRTNAGTTNVGVVTAEEVLVRVDTKIEGDTTFKLGVHPLGGVAPIFSAGWADFLDNMQGKDLTVTLHTVVMYKGTINNAAKIIDVTTITCPKGLMFSGCVSQIDATEKGIQLLYKEKHSYLK